MVLDAKALSWAAQNGIDTAKLKAGKVPIYGKWYFPEIPPGVPMVNLETGEQVVFPERMYAGEVIFAPTADLRRAGLLPDDFPSAPTAPAAGEAGPATPVTATTALHTIAPEPLLALARPPGLEPAPTTAIVPAETIEPEPMPSGIHMPSASIAPFVLGLGFCITFLGLIAGPIILIVGLVWMLAGAIGWIRIGLLEARAAEAHAAHAAEAEPLP